MNTTTTIHFVQDQASQLPINNQSYSWSNLESNINGVSLPTIQQVHYVDPNLTLLNNTSTKLIQMGHLESTNQSIANTVTNHNEPTYLTPLINLSLSESINYYSDNNSNNHNANHNANSTAATLSSLPSMATSFGSSIFVQQQSNVNNLINNKTNKKLGAKPKLNKISWTIKRKTTTGNKLNEQKLKYSAETSLNGLTNKITKKTSQVTRGRKRIPKNLMQNLTNASTAVLQSTTSTANPSTNLTMDQYQPNKNVTSVSLNMSTNSIESNNSLYSLNSCSDSSMRKGKKSKSDSNDPSVKRRNQRERMRVHMLNLGYENLRAKLPNSNKKMPKVQTLRNATQYIKNLQQMLKESSTLIQSTPSSSSTTYCIDYL